MQMHSSRRHRGGGGGGKTLLAPFLPPRPSIPSIPSLLCKSVSRGEVSPPPELYNRHALITKLTKHLIPSPSFPPLPVSSCPRMLTPFPLRRRLYSFAIRRSMNAKQPPTQCQNIPARPNISHALCRSLAHLSNHLVTRTNLSSVRQATTPKHRRTARRLRSGRRSTEMYEP